MACHRFNLADSIVLFLEFFDLVNSEEILHSIYLILLHFMKEPNSSVYSDMGIRANDK